MFDWFFPDVKLDGTVCGFTIAGTGSWGCAFELSPQFRIRACLFLEHFHDRKTIFCPVLTGLIPKDPADVEMSMDVKKEGEDVIESTATLSV